jgi:hypothetical protein
VIAHENGQHEYDQIENGRVDGSGHLSFLTVS